MIHTSQNSRILFLRSISFAVLTLEQLVRCFWRVLTLIGFFLALWLFQIPSIFGIWSEAVALFAFISAIFYFLWVDGRLFHFPTRRDIDRRIEKDSGVKNRPLSGLQDRLVNADQDKARDLWVIAKTRLTALLPLLHPAKFQAFMARHDPYALRLGVLMAFILGLFAAGPDAGMRIRHGLMPFQIEGVTTGIKDHYTIWITAPEYTRTKQLVINENTIDGDIIDIPEGSTIKAVVNRGWGTPKLYLGDVEHRFTQNAGNSFGVEVSLKNDRDPSAQAIQDDNILILKQGFRTLATHPYEIIPDNAPSIVMSDDQQKVLAKSEMQFELSVKDDYGVEFLDMRVRLDDMVEKAPIGEEFYERRSVVSPPAQDFDMTPVYDLTAHPWAGLPAIVEFTAIDHIGQKSMSDPIKIVLPERSFSHPVAKTLVALRKELAWQPEDESVYAEVSYDLQVLLTATELLHNDVVAYLGIRSAASRLKYNEPSIEASKSIMALMWDTALRIEDGDLSLAARRLREAQQALEQATQNPEISDEEISALMHELRQAMAQYFNELGREMQKRMESGEAMPMLPPEMMKNMMRSDALSDFLDQLEAEMRDGNKNSAQQLLSQMQRLMDMLNPSMGAAMPQDMQMMQKGINELEELIKRQESLLAQTRDQASILDMLGGLGMEYGQRLPNDRDLMREWGMDDMPPAPDTKKEGGKAPFVNTAEHKVEQDALRFILGQLMVEASERIGNIPEGMGAAELNMRDSSEALEGNDPVASIPHQEQAIENLKQSQQQMAQQLQQRMQQMTGFMLSFGGGGMQHDPLGRPYGEGDDEGQGYGSNVKIPDESERRRVDEILQLLRRRASQHDRPREELQYYRRLLKRF